MSINIVLMVMVVLLLVALLFVSTLYSTSSKKRINFDLVTIFNNKTMVYGVKCRLLVGNDEFIFAPNYLCDEIKELK